QEVAPLPARLDGARYHVLLPPVAIGVQRPVLDLVSATFRVPGDPRALAWPVSTLVVRPLGAGWPPLISLAAWLGLLALVWITFGLFQPASGRWRWLIYTLAVAIVLASMLDPARAALAPFPFLAAALNAALLCALSNWRLTGLMNRLGVPLSSAARGWLLALVFLSCTLRWGAKLYPGAMPGDVLFHANRFAELIGGRVFLEAPHRGVPSPYAPGFYIAVAPLTLLGAARPAILVAVGALLDAISPVAIYALVLLVWHWRPSTEAAPALERQALMAAGLYAFAGGGFLVTWWNFSTHTFAQWAYLVLLVAGVAAWRCAVFGGRHVFTAIGVLTALQLGVLLGHFSFYLNLVLVGGYTLAVTWLAWRRARVSRAQWAGLSATIILAHLLALLLFYSVYVPTLVGQASAVGSGADQAVTSSGAAMVAYLVSIMGDGLTEHFGLFPFALAICGTLILAGQGGRPGRQAGCVVAGATWFVVALFLALPLVSGANLATRWLMFAFPVVCAMAPAAAQRLWRRGGAGRVALIVIGLFVVWVSAAIWLGALAWRIRPPEPF
ncbi:MAG TPA: hypothetical protein VFT99_21865, partial [Roseiflexaceae bacterium]|nr:hypothetical protein [Roseiflexaceae bacterium]